MADQSAPAEKSVLNSLLCAILARFYIEKAKLSGSNLVLEPLPQGIQGADLFQAISGLLKIFTTLVDVVPEAKLLDVGAL